MPWSVADESVSVSVPSWGGTNENSCSFALNPPVQLALKTFDPVVVSPALGPSAAAGAWAQAPRKGQAGSCEQSISSAQSVKPSKSLSRPSWQRPDSTQTGSPEQTKSAQSTTPLWLSSRPLAQSSAQAGSPAQS